MKTTTKNNKSRRSRYSGDLYNVTLTTEENGVRFLNARKYVHVNQYRSEWRDVPSRELARLVNRNKLVIK